MLGYTSEELISKPAFMFGATKQEADELFAVLLQQGLWVGELARPTTKMGTVV